MIIYQLGRRA
jgi:hypothetical protein